MYLRTLRPPALPGATPYRRRFPWARIILILALAGAAAYIFAPRYFSIKADGLVRGDLVPVATIFSAQITNRFVECEQQVRRGQPLAVVSNFLLEGQYAQNYEKAQEGLREQQLAQTEGVTQARIDAESAREKYLSSLYSARKLRLIQDAYGRTYREGAIGRVAFANAEADSESAAAEAETMRQVWTAAQERVRRLITGNTERVAAYSNEVTLMRSLKNQVRSETLTAPITGRVVECSAQPQAIVQAGSPLYSIFSPDRAYILAFFDPGSITRLHIGQQADITVPGVSGRVNGRIAAIYPKLAKLPDQLTRFFWQHEQWSEYRPVKIVFSAVGRDAARELIYDAQVRVSVPQRNQVWLAALQREVGLR